MCWAYPLTAPELLKGSTQKLWFPEIILSAHVTCVVLTSSLHGPKKFKSDKSSSSEKPSWPRSNIVTTPKPCLLGWDVEVEQAEDTLAAQGTQSESSLISAARILKLHISRRAAPDMEALSLELGVTYTELKKRLFAASEALLVNQANCLDHVIQYVRRFLVARQLVPVAFIERVSFDETPLLANVSFGGQRYVEKARIFVLEKSWTLLVRNTDTDSTDSNHGLRPPAQYLAVLGGMSPLIRAAENCKGEGILPLLRQTQHTTQAKDFQFHFRISECDAAGANLRAEAMLSAESETSFTAIFQCSAHKGHKAAERCWQLPVFAKVISGLIHAGLTLSAPQALKLLRDGLLVEVGSRPVRIFKVGAPSPESDVYRKKILSLFAPSKGPRRRALLELMATTLLNGNWESHALEHDCLPHCRCSGEEDIREAVQFVISKILKAVRPGVFQRGDWLNWLHNLKGFGLLEGLHGLLTPAFLRHVAPAPGIQNDVLGGILGGEVGARDVDNLGFLLPPDADAHGAIAGLDPGLDRVEVQRRQRLQHQAKSHEFFQTPDWHRHLVMLSQALLPQVQLMQSILHKTSVEWEASQQRSLQEQGTRLWPVLELHKKTDINAMLQNNAIIFFDPALNPVPDDEGNRSLWLQACMRPAAAVYQLLGVKVEGFPYKLFSLLEDRTHENAQMIAQAPPCMLDDFSAQILQQFPTVASLTSSSDLVHILGCCATMVAGTTFSTERLHSGNARRSRAAAHTHKRGVEQLAMQSSSWAAPSWLRPPQRKGQKEHKKLGPKKRKESTSEAPKAKKSRGGGGAWRAFVHHQIQHAGEKNDFKMLATKFANLDASTMQYYRELGAMGRCVGQIT